ncbi:MAG: hypothetical protein ACFNWZ_01420 [Candidatus Absconditicoccaceae bacterium]
MKKNFSELTPTFGLAHKGGVPPSSGMECFHVLKMFGSFLLLLLLLLPFSAKGQTSVPGTDRGTQEKITTSSAAASQQKADAPSSTVSDKISVRSKGLSPEECMKIVQEDAYKRNPELREYDLAQAERRKSQAQKFEIRQQDVRLSARKAPASVLYKELETGQQLNRTKTRKSSANQTLDSKEKNSKVMKTVAQVRAVQSWVINPLPPLENGSPKVVASVEASSKSLVVVANVPRSLILGDIVELVVHDSNREFVICEQMEGNLLSSDPYVRFRVTLPISCFRNGEVYLFRVNQWNLITMQGHQLTGFLKKVSWNERSKSAVSVKKTSPPKHQTILQILPAGNNGAKFVVKTTEKLGAGECIYLRIYDSVEGYTATLPLKARSIEGNFTVYSYLEKDLSVYLPVLRRRTFRVFLGWYLDLSGRQLCACETDLSYLPFYRNRGDNVLLM